MKFYCIADEDTVRGFRLAGVPGQVATTAPEAAVAFERAMARADCGILVLTETVAAGIGRQVEAARQERDRPLIIEIPGPHGQRAGRKSLRQVVQEAVGIRVG